jgi:nitrite reductase/ring-hydroxylating ferredoxin subunit
MPWTKLAVLADLPPGALIEVERPNASGESDRFAICNVAGEVRALWGDCPHQGGPLGEGALNGELITCPWHMWEFHSGTGVCAFNPGLAIPTYPVKIENGDIMVDIA